MKFDSDDEAAKYAEEVDGVKLIHDIQFEPGNPNYAKVLEIDGADFITKSI